MRASDDSGNDAMSQRRGADGKNQAKSVSAIWQDLSSRDAARSADGVV
jgi:hypothetical protein